MFILAFAVSLLPPLVAGCGSDSASPGGTGGTGGGGAGGAGAVCDAPAMVFVPSCGVGGCHSAGGEPPDLSSPGVFARLLNQPQMVSPACVGMNLVNPAKPASGVLLKRLSGVTCGLQMPYGTPVTVQSYVDCVTSWVNAQLP